MSTDDLIADQQRGLIYFFRLDLSPITGDTKDRFNFYAANAKYNTPITTDFISKYQVILSDEVFQPLIITIDNLALENSGKNARPTLKFTKVDPIVAQISKYINLASDEFLGAGITFNAKFAKSSGVEDSVYSYGFFYISRKVSETRFFIEFELSSPFDVEHIQYPRRVVSKDICLWVYKSGQCSWDPSESGKYYNQKDVACSESDDMCGKTIRSCFLRFRDNPMPFGGFPGVK